MKKLFIYLFILAGCKTLPSPTPVCEPDICDVFDALIIATIINDELVLHPAAIKLDFDNGAPIDTFEIVIDEESKKPYLFRQSHFPGGCQISRTELVVSGSTYLMRMPGMTEVCSSKNCGYCGFKQDGCECVDSFGICEYSTIKNRDIIRLN